MKKLIAGLGVGALQALLTPLVATLAMANEPLAEQEIITFLRLREEIPDGEAGNKLVTKGLAAIASMLRRAPDPEGEDGFMLHHLSLREHILTTETMSHHVEKSRKAFAKAAMSPDDEASISNYLYRTGIDHLLSNDQVDDAREKLLDIDYLGKMFNLEKQYLDILQYWLKIGDDDQGQSYIVPVKKYLERDLKEEDLDVLCDFISFLDIADYISVGAQLGKMVTKAHIKLLGPEHRLTLWSKFMLAGFLKDKGELDTAEALYREVIEVRERVFGPEDPGTLTAKQSFAVFLRNKSNYPEKSIPLLEEIHIVRRKQNNQEDLSSILTALGTSYGKCKFFNEAINMLQESINIRRKLFANGDQSFKEPLISTLKRLLDVYRAIGKKKEIEKTAEEIKILSN